MVNTLYIEAYSTTEDLQDSNELTIPLESFITYCVYKTCSPEEVSLIFVPVRRKGAISLALNIKDENLTLIAPEEVPWQVSSCLYPVILYEDTVITGLCGVARHICKYRSLPQSPLEHEEGLLGFRKGCLQAPNEVSVWTKFCEIEVVRTVKHVLNSEKLTELPINLVRFENHLNKPVRLHNVFKIARNIKKESLIAKYEKEAKYSNGTKEETGSKRIPKTRKWKSNIKKELELNCPVKIEDLDISHQFAEGPYLTVADLMLTPLYHILFESLGESTFETFLPLTHKWMNNVKKVPELNFLVETITKLRITKIPIENIVVPTTEDVSLYKCDPKRNNPKKRLFTKDDDIENALNALSNGVELDMSSNKLECTFNWNDIPDGANPTAGHLPDERVVRKSQQLQNLTLAVLSVAKEGDLVVDFCSGSGHLGILIAHLLPKCTVILLENKEQSLLRARQRVHEMELKNVYFFQCNLDFFIGKFDVGIALHACGIASDLVLDKCLKSNAKFVLCPCCYGSLHATDRLVYPRSKTFSCITIDQYMCIGHAADQTHEDHPLTVRGDKCMAVIDSDRGRLAEEFGYKVTLSRLKPLTCSPKNNLLIGVPS